LQLQLAALPGFEQQLDTVLAQLPGFFAEFSQDLLAAGVDPSSFTQSDVVALQQSLAANGFPVTFQPAIAALGVDASTQQQIVTMLTRVDPGAAAALLQNRFAIGAVLPPPSSAAGNQPQFAALLPASRSVEVGNPATAFATIINSGTAVAQGCKIVPLSVLPSGFAYQTTDPATNALTGTINTPVDIPPGGSQSFVISLTPNGAFPPVSTQFSFFCANAPAAPPTVALNTLLLSAATTPVPDIVALAASSDPGVVDLTGSSHTGVFAVATVNVGAAGQISVSADTGNATLPVTITVCQTNPMTSVCLAPPSSFVWQRSMRAIHRPSASLSPPAAWCRLIRPTTGFLYASTITPPRAAVRPALLFAAYDAVASGPSEYGVRN
jgi:hypothetical protein